MNNWSIEPSSYKEAISGNDMQRWIQVMDEEMASLYKNKTCKLVENPNNQRVVGCNGYIKLNILPGS